ncbi:putative Serine/threonine-protein phosphatase 2 [Vibrio chagasii]|nr:putative Serine/threonine-protein phosphatase 2 [Vibrio chagasii]
MIFTTKQIIDTTKYDRVFFCGDIHGQYRRLLKSMDKVGFNKERDIIVCTGDLCDRGEESIQCLSLLNEDWFFSALGNHDYVMWAAITGGDINESKSHWLQFWKHKGFGSDWYFNLDKESQKTLRASIENIRDLPITLELSLPHNGKEIKFGITHADIYSYDWNNIPFDRLREIEITQTRDKFRMVRDGDEDYVKAVKNVDYLITGHTNVQRISNIKNHYYIDIDHKSKGSLKLINAFDFINGLDSIDMGVFSDAGGC